MIRTWLYAYPYTTNRDFSDPDETFDHRLNASHTYKEAREVVRSFDKDCACCRRGERHTYLRHWMEVDKKGRTA